MNPTTGDMCDCPVYRIATMESYQTRQRELRAERRAEFAAERSDVPDLEFLTPECPICGLGTTFDDGSFECEECRIVWPRSGYGHEAERHSEDDNA